MADGILNDQGQVAVKHRKQIPRYVRLGNGHEYAFSMHSSVSMSWVDPVDVPALFNIKEGCCGGPKRSAFLYANERDVQLWTS